MITPKARLTSPNSYWQSLLPVALLSAVPEKILTSESEPLSEEELQCHSAALAPVMLQYRHHCCSDAAVPQVCGIGCSA